MYIDLAIVEGLLFFGIVILILIAVVAAIGWSGYIRLTAENDMLKQENRSLKHVIGRHNQRKNIRVANEYNEEEN